MIGGGYVLTRTNQAAAGMDFRVSNIRRILRGGEDDGKVRLTENCETSPSPSMKDSRIGSHVPRSAKYLQERVSDSL